MDAQDRETIRTLIAENGLADVVSEVRFVAYDIALKSRTLDMFDPTKEATRLRARIQSAEDIGNWLTKILSIVDCRYI